MLKIAICDDDKLFCTELENMLYTISQELKILVSIDLYYHAISFKKRIQDKQDYDLIFLDIELNEMLGSELGDFIRNHMNWQKVGIIYISVKSNYAMSLFKTRPHDFIIKPIIYKEVKDSFETFIKLYHTNNKVFQYKQGTSYHKIFYDDILYFESINKMIKIHCINETVSFYGKLIDIVDELSHDFLNIHKSFLVNYNKISKFHYDEIVLINGETLPISQSKRQEVRKIQLKRWVNSKS